MLKRGKNERVVIEMVDAESLMPFGYLLRQMDAAVDFEKFYEILEALNREEEWRGSIDPVVLFKIVLLQHLDGNASLRGTLRRAQTDAPQSRLKSEEENEAGSTGAARRYQEELLAEVNADREAHGKSLWMMKMNHPKLERRNWKPWSSPEISMTARHLAMFITN